MFRLVYKKKVYSHFGQVFQLQGDDNIELNILLHLVTAAQMWVNESNFSVMSRAAGLITRPEIQGRI